MSFWYSAARGILKRLPLSILYRHILIHFASLTRFNCSTLSADFQAPLDFCGVKQSIVLRFCFNISTYKPPKRLLHVLNLTQWICLSFKISGKVSIVHLLFISCVFIRNRYIHMHKMKIKCTTTGNIMLLTTKIKNRKFKTTKNN